MLRLAVAFVLLAASASCLRPFRWTWSRPAWASDADRVAAAHRWFARVDEQTLVASLHGAAKSPTTDHLFLGDGTRVYHAEDLIPIIAADSPTAHRTGLARRRAGAARPWAAGTAVAFASTMAVIVASPFLSSKTWIACRSAGSPHRRAVVRFHLNGAFFARDGPKPGWCRPTAIARARSTILAGQAAWWNA